LIARSARKDRAWKPLPSSLTLADEERVCSFVQDSGARSWALWIRRRRRRSPRKNASAHSIYIRSAR
jgi:hypothetical protein